MRFVSIVKDRGVNNISSESFQEKIHNLCDSNMMHIFSLLVSMEKLCRNKSISIN